MASGRANTVPRREARRGSAKKACESGTARMSRTGRAAPPRRSGAALLTYRSACGERPFGASAYSGSMESRPVTRWLRILVLTILVPAYGMAAAEVTMFAGGVAHAQHLLIEGHPADSAINP